MPQLQYIKGNVVSPVHPKSVIAHICNDVGKMGSGVAKSISDKWPSVKREYISWYNAIDTKYDFELGKTIFVPVQSFIDIVGKIYYTGENYLSYIIVANMIAQHRIMSMGEEKPIRYDALDKCLQEVNEFCRDYGFTLHMPRIGTERAGGSWEEVEPLIVKNMLVDTWIYNWDRT